MHNSCETCRLYFKPGQTAVCLSVSVSSAVVSRRLDIHLPAEISQAREICDGKFHELPEAELAAGGAECQS